MIITLKDKQTLIADEFQFKCCIGKNGKSINKKEGDFKTPKGKIVYGGGGIIPDVFVALDTTSYLSNFYFNSINNFAFNFVDNNRTSLNKWTLSAFISDFDADEAVLKSYLTTHKVGKKQGFKTRQRIQKYLKAAIANTLFGDEGFYRVLHQDDKMLQKVVTLETSD